MSDQARYSMKASGTLIPRVLAGWRSYLVGMISALCNLAELFRIAEEAVQCAPDRARPFEGSHRGVDLWAAGAEQLRQFALGEAEFEWHAFSGRRTARAERGQQELREPHVQGLERDRLELRRRLPETATEKRYYPRRNGRPVGPQIAERMAFQAMDLGRCEGGRIGGSWVAIERGDLAEHVAFRGMAEAQFAVIGGGDCEPDAAALDEIEVVSRIAASKNRFALGEKPLLERCRHGREVAGRKSAKEARPRQQRYDCSFARHARPPKAPPACRIGTGSDAD
jgi:hypothetical protein